MRILCKPLLTAAFPLLLAACQAGAPAAPAEAGQTACAAERFGQWVGKPLESLDKSQLPAQTRILHPDSVATMDYRADRLNVHVDASGKVARVVCG